MCQADSNCILVEDGGLTSSYTIAHEIGHRYLRIYVIPYMAKLFVCAHKYAYIHMYIYVHNIMFLKVSVKIIMS